MIPRPADRGRAEAFATALERPGPLPEDGEVNRLVRTAEALCRAEVETPRPMFAQELRDRLMSEAPAALAPPRVVKKVVRVRPAPPSARAGVRRRLGALAATFAIAGGSFGMVTTSAQALPGQMLYPVKRGVENAQVALQRGPSAVGNAKLELAQTRLAEVRELVADGDDGAREARLVNETLDDFSTEATQGADSLFASYAEHGHARTIETLTEFTRSSARTLSQLSRQLPEGAGHSYTGATSVVSGLNSQAGRVCSTCHVTALTGLPTSLRAQVQSLAGSSAATEGSASGAGDDATGDATSSHRAARERGDAQPRGASTTNGRHPKQTTPDTTGATQQHGRHEVGGSAPDLSDLRKSVVPDQPARPRSNGPDPGSDASATQPGADGKLTGPLGKVVNPVLEGLLGPRGATDDASADNGGGATNPKQSGHRRTGGSSSNGSTSGGSTSGEGAGDGDRGLLPSLLGGLTHPD